MEWSGFGLGWAERNEEGEGMRGWDGMGSTLHYLQYGVRITCVCGYSDDYLPSFTSLFFFLLFFGSGIRQTCGGMSG